MRFSLSKNKKHIHIFVAAISVFAIVAIIFCYQFWQRQVAHGNPSALLTRLSGSTRYATAVAVSQQAYAASDSAAAVVLASGENFPDALTVSPLAYKLNGPLLLTQKNTLPSAVLTEIERVLPGGAPVYIVGGTSAVSDTVKNAVEAAGFPVTRIEGADRILTSIAVATAINPSPPASVFIVNSDSYADGISASSPASYNSYPILLNTATTLNASVQSYLDSLTLQHIYIIGGTSVISQTVEDTLTTLYADGDTTVTRITGSDRYATSQSIASAFYQGGTSPTVLTFSNGAQWADGLVGGVFAARQTSPLLLVRTNSVPGVTSDYIISLVAQLTNTYLIGGASVLDATLETAVDNLSKTGDTGTTVVAVGDIACDTTDPNYNGGAGTATNCHMQATSDLTTAIGPSAVLALGDIQYEDGTLANFNASYAATWGVHDGITYPVPGNHEYHTADAEGYFDYFNGVGVPTGRAGDRTKGYYSFDLGSWHLVALNSNCADIGGCGVGSAQAVWLQSDLASNTATCTLAYWHHAHFTSGPHNSASDTDRSTTFWDYLYADQADVVLNGHDHIYERFNEQTPSAVANESAIREFIVGTGGKSSYAISGSAANSAAQVTQTYGVLVLRLYDWGYVWKFEGEDQSILDSGSDVCS